MNMYVTLSSTCFRPWHAHLQEEQLHKHSIWYPRSTRRLHTTPVESGLMHGRKNIKLIKKRAEELSQYTARTIYTALWPLTVHTSACAVTYVAIDAISTVPSILTWRNLLWPHCTFINIFLTVFPHVAWMTATHWSLQYHHRLSFCSCLQTLVPVREPATIISYAGTKILKNNLVQWLQSSATWCHVVGNHMPNYLPCTFKWVIPLCCIQL